MAKAKQIPVIVASESYKFSDKVQLDAIVHNELGSTSEIAIMTRADGVTPTSSSSSSSAGASSSSSSSSSSAPQASSSSATHSTPGGKQLFVPMPQMQYGYRGCADSNNITTNSSTGSSSSGSKTMMTIEPPIVIPSQWRNSSSSGNHQASSSQLPFNVLNLRYDLTPINNISVVATETGLIPPTSIPVLIREIQSDTYQSVAYY